MKYKISNAYLTVNGQDVSVGTVLGPEDQPSSPFMTEVIPNSEYEKGLRQFIYGKAQICDLVYHNVGSVVDFKVAPNVDPKWIDELKLMGYDTSRFLTKEPDERIDEQLSKINKQMHQLSIERQKLERLSNAVFQEKSTVNIGRCFKDLNTGAYIKVIDVPQVQETMTGPTINRYQYPAIYVGSDIVNENSEKVPFFSDTLFSGAWGEGNDPFHKYQEIPHELFEKEFKKALKEFEQNVLSIGGTK